MQRIGLRNAAVCLLLLVGRAAAIHPGPGAPPAVAAPPTPPVLVPQQLLPKHDGALGLRGGSVPEAGLRMARQANGGVGEWGLRESKEQLFYRLQSLMLSSPFYKFLTIMSSASACILFSGLLLKGIEVVAGGESESWASAMFTAYTLVAETPSKLDARVRVPLASARLARGHQQAALTARVVVSPGSEAAMEEYEKSMPKFIVTNVIFFLGIFTFAIMLGIVTSTIEQQVDHLMEANYRSSNPKP